MNNQHLRKLDWPVVESIAQGVHYLFNQMIVQANSRPLSKGEPKVGGHSSACASALHILGALHLIVRKGYDFIANKPHASPTDHSYHYLLNLLFHKDGAPFSDSEAEKVMHGLREFPSKNQPHVFQSYHSHYDPDHYNFLPSGTVGIPPVVLGYLALAFNYLKDQGYDVPPSHFWSLIGDSEFREGSLFEAIPDLAERKVGSVTWIIDYNRQSLDGHRFTPTHLESDSKRIENTFTANGWDVIQVLHGSKRMSLFEKSNGEKFKNFLENKLSDWSLQILLQITNMKEARKLMLQHDSEIKPFLEKISDEDLKMALHDLGGHDLKVLTQALLDSKKDTKKPCAIIVHTIKGWGLQMASQGGNHSAIPTKEEVGELLKKTNLSQNSGLFPRFEKSSLENQYLKKKSQELKKEIQQQDKMKEKNSKMWNIPHLPQELGVSLKMMSYPHTQWMIGQWMAKMNRISNSDKKSLSENEKRFLPLSQLFISLSPDVGTSTNLSFNMDDKIYQSHTPHQKEEDWDIHSKHSPNLSPHTQSKNRFFRFEIAEAAAVSCLSAFGKTQSIIGVPLFPVMSVYDFFVKRALDQYFYALYWGSSFILAGTPSGITLSSEGAQHGWKSDLQIPNQICWEPYFCQEVDWILTDSLYKHITNHQQNRSGILMRAVTRGADQKNFLRYLKMQKRFKKSNQLLHPKNFPLAQAVDESSVEALPETKIYQNVREQVLKGAYTLIDFKGYADYSSSENVVNIFAMGALGTEALKASEELLKQGIYANVIIVTSPDLLLGALGHQTQYAYLKNELSFDHKAPIVSVHDGEPGLLDNIGSITGLFQEVLAVRKHSLCGSIQDVYSYHQLNASSIVQSSIEVLNRSVEKK